MKLRAWLKWGIFNKGEQGVWSEEAFYKGGQGSFAMKCFTKIYYKSQNMCTTLSMLAKRYAVPTITLHLESDPE
jgi:hypothetical protein